MSVLAHGSWLGEKSVSLSFSTATSVLGPLAKSAPMMSRPPVLTAGLRLQAPSPDSSVTRLQYFFTGFGAGFFFVVALAAGAATSATTASTARMDRARMVTPGWLALNIWVTCPDVLLLSGAVTAWHIRPL